MRNDPLPRDTHPLAHTPLREAYEDFLLSRKVLRCTGATLIHYHYSAGEFVGWLEQHDVCFPEQVEPRHVRAWQGGFTTRRLKDTTQHAKARGVRTLLRFWHAEGYMPGPLPMSMPKIEQKRMPCLTADELRAVLEACGSVRERAILLLMADTGLRRAELCALNWQDVDLNSGLVNVVRGKGGKSRSVAIGLGTRKAMMVYRRSVGHSPDAPVVQTKAGTRLRDAGLRTLLRRLGGRAGIKLSPHMLRRTFATLSLRAGMSPLHLQGLLGHTTLEMTRRYVQMTDGDLMAAHRDHGPIDTFLR